MNNYASRNVYYNFSIIKLVDEFVSEGFELFSKLEEIDQDMLSAECIKTLGNDSYNCIIQPDDFDQVLHHFTQYLMTAKREYAQDMAETMRKNANLYFAEKLDPIFTERTNLYRHNSSIEGGLKAVRDQQTGEMRYL